MAHPLLSAVSRMRSDVEILSAYRSRKSLSAVEARRANEKWREALLENMLKTHEHSLSRFSKFTKKELKELLDAENKRRELHISDVLKEFVLQDHRKLRAMIVPVLSKYNKDQKIKVSSPRNKSDYIDALKRASTGNPKFATLNNDENVRRVVSMIPDKYKKTSNFDVFEKIELEEAWIDAICVFPDGIIAFCFLDEIFVYEERTDGTGGWDQIAVLKDVSECIVNDLVIVGFELVSVCNNGKVCFWGRWDLNSEITIKNKLSLTCVASNGDDSVVIGDVAGNLTVCRRDTSWSVESSWDAHDGGIRSVAVLSDGRFISGGDDEKLCIWNGEIEESSVNRHVKVVKKIAVLSDDRVVLLTSRLVKCFQVWKEVSDGVWKREYADKNVRDLSSIKTFDATTVVCGSSLGGVYIYKERSVGDWTSFMITDRFADDVTSVAVSDGRIFAGSEDGISIYS